LAIGWTHEIHQPPDTKLHVLDDVDVEMLWPYINPMMLYARHLGLKGRVDDLVAKGDKKALELKKLVKEVEDEALAKNQLRARCLWRFFRAARVDAGRGQADVEDTIAFFDGDAEVARIAFPRQPAGERRCIADLVPSISSGKRDHVALFVTSCQGRTASMRALADRLKEDGAYVKMHALQAIAIETAEALAEWLHESLRKSWGIGDAPTTTKQDLFQAHYAGRRYSFGYPACPRLDDQAILWRLLEPQKHIGVELTEGFMMEPEASVSALVFQHPQAAYFSAGASES
jgi:5-methyltetrahydrofolate--homocysteine methyltransferase